MLYTYLSKIGPNGINEWAAVIPPSPLLESSQKRPHEAEVSSAKGHHNWRELLDFKPGTTRNFLLTIVAGEPQAPCSRSCNAYFSVILVGLNFIIRTTASCS